MIVVGSVNVDLVIRGPRLPAPGETVTGGTFERHQGGKGANQSVAAARLGAPTLFVGLVGDDDLGADARAALAADGVDVAALDTASGTPTGVALILVDEAGENLISAAPGANGSVTAGHVERALARIR
ncbi:MAG TPA: PfkB family carbohydrate kinase, partial [Candidatus Limnocylindrales bacterium]|nr:PfkB family carbohydrate kinase [Candidatus Limnocylindrales bacterium]